MNKQISFNSFIENFDDQIRLAMENNITEYVNEDFFSMVMLDYLEEIGEIEEPVICPYRSHGLQLSAYCLSEDYQNVDIIVSLYVDREKNPTVPRADIDAALKRGIQLYRKAINDLFASLEKDTDVYSFANNIYTKRDKISNLRIIALTNGNVKDMSFNNITIGGVEVNFLVWDIDKLYRCVVSGKMRETIEIDLINDCDAWIECIEIICSETYKSYLSVVPGKTLALLYDKYGSRLLERNVRAFLQVKGKVNKGIKITLQDSPDMFLAYNNGISVTAESIELLKDDKGKLLITKIRDMQIVNGGQTTASIFNAYKKDNCDLSSVFVQMKLSVISDPDDMDTIIPKISAYANTQNKIQIADFSANDPFHRKIEEFSRTVWTPVVSGGYKPTKWFYERARGQYSEIRSQNKRKFDEEYPKNQFFTKTDLAKFENIWEQNPHIVSKGAQKCFKEFMIMLDERKFIPDQIYYQHLISKAILFKRSEKIIQEQKYGGYRANIIAYTLAWLIHHTSQRINLNKIWEEQRISDLLEETIITVSRIIQKKIVNPPNGANITEWCKNIKCWYEIRDTIIDLNPLLEKELISVAKSKINQNENKSFKSITENELGVIKEVMEISGKNWFALAKWAKETNNFQPRQRAIAFSVGMLINRHKEPSFKQAISVLRLYKDALEKGFIPEI